MKILLIVISLFLSISSHASDIQQSTKAPYSPAISGNNNNINYYINGLDSRTRAYYEKQLKLKDKELKKLKKTDKERKIALEKYASNIKMVNDFIVREKNKSGGNIDFAIKVEKLLQDGKLDEATSLVGQGAQAGAGKITGEGNNVTVVNNAPQGIAISGGIVNNPTVTNYKVPRRRIPLQLESEIIEILKKHPTRVDIGYIEKDIEGEIFASDWRDVFKASGWTIVNVGRILLKSDPLIEGVYIYDLSKNPSVQDDANKSVLALVEAMKRLNISPIVNKGLATDEHIFTELSPKSRSWYEDPTSRGSSELSTNRMLQQ